MCFLSEGGNDHATLSSLRQDAPDEGITRVLFKKGGSVMRRLYIERLPNGAVMETMVHGDGEVRYSVKNAVGVIIFNEALTGRYSRNKAQRMAAAQAQAAQTAGLVLQ